MECWRSAVAEIRQLMQKISGCTEAIQLVGRWRHVTQCEERGMQEEQRSGEATKVLAEIL